jgi:GMP synthase (glutamine-hydrolysing)
MKEPFLVLKNAAREGPGLLGEELQECGINYDIVELDHGQSIPLLEGYGALVVLGGPKSANDDNDSMRDELAFIHEAIAQGIPYLGICLGLQTLVKAAGGKVVRSPVEEVGLRDPSGRLFTVELTTEGRADPLFEDLDDSLFVFQLHGETVEMAGGMSRLAEGKFCRNQIVRVGANAYGIQCHFELTSGMLSKWIDEDPDLCKLDGGKLLSDFEAIKDEYTRVGKRLLHNFFKIAGY